MTELGIVSIERLDALAAEAPERESPPSRRPTGGRLDMETYLKARDVEHESALPWKDGATRWRLKRCPFCKHGPPDSLVVQFADGATTFKCSHNSCAGRKWAAFTEQVGAPDPGHYDRPPAAPGGTAPPQPRRVREIPAYRPFPADALPAFLPRFVGEAATAVGCDPAFTALPLLAVLGGAIGNTRRVRLKGGATGRGRKRRGWTEPAVVWAVGVGMSGDSKSPGADPVVDPLLDRHAANMSAFKAEMDRYRIDSARARRAKVEPPDEPTATRVLCADITIERLAGVLQDNPRGTVVYRDELSGWVGSFTRYRASADSSDVPHWLEIHRAGPIDRSRQTGDRRDVYVRNAAVSVGGTIQPDVLRRALTPELFRCGLPARLLLAMPPRRKKVWTEAVLSDALADKYDALLGTLLKLEGTEKDGQVVPVVLGLDREAKRLWVAFYRE
jgi:hypothetical protein